MKKIIFKISIVVYIVSNISFANSITIKGVVKVKGSVPHTYIVIEDIKSKKDYKITNVSDFNLTKIQNSAINVELNITKEAIGASFPATANIIKIKN